MGNSTITYTNEHLLGSFFSKTHYKPMDTFDRALQYYFWKQGKQQKAQKRSNV